MQDASMGVLTDRSFEQRLQRGIAWQALEDFFL